MNLIDAPLDRRVVTPREAEEQLGIPASSIRAWASQKRLFAVSIDRNRSRWYRLADVLALAATTRRRVRHARPRRRHAEVDITCLGR